MLLFKHLNMYCALVQTLEHVLCSCSLTLEVRQRHGFQNKSVGEIMNENDYGRLALMLRGIENNIYIHNSPLSERN